MSPWHWVAFRIIDPTWGESSGSSLPKFPQNGSLMFSLLLYRRSCWIKSVLWMIWDASELTLPQFNEGDRQSLRVIWNLREMERRKSLTQGYNIELTDGTSWLLELDRFGGRKYERWNTKTKTHNPNLCYVSKKHVNISHDVRCISIHRYILAVYHTMTLWPRKHFLHYWPFVITGGFPSQRANNGELLCILWC